MELTAYAPFIQFIAGIYLVSMCDEILDKNPLKKQFTNVTDLLVDIANTYQGNLNDNNRKRIAEIKEPSALDNKWKRFSPSLKFVSIVSFFYCLFMLYFIGMEKANDGSEQIFIVQSIAVTIYICAVAILTFRNFRGWLDFFLSTNLVVGIILILGLYTFGFMTCGNWIAEHIYCFNNIEPNIVKSYALIVSVLGLLLYAFSYIVVWFKEVRLQFQLKKLKNTLDTVFNFQIGIIKKLDEKLWGEIMNGDTDTGQQIGEKLELFISKKVNESVSENIAPMVPS